MVDFTSEADRLHEAGRKKILRVCLIRGSQLLLILVVAGLQYAGAIRLEEYLWVDQDKVDLRMLWLILGVGASFQFLIVAIGVLQAWAGIRRAERVREQSGETR